MKGFIHYKLVEHIRAVTADINCQQLDGINKVLHVFRFGKQEWCKGTHPPYSSDLALTDFHWFPLTEYSKSGREFRNKVENSLGGKTLIPLNMELKIYLHVGN